MTAENLVLAVVAVVVVVSAVVFAVKCPPTYAPGRVPSHETPLLAVARARVVSVDPIEAGIAKLEAGANDPALMLFEQDGSAS